MAPQAGASARSLEDEPLPMHSLGREGSCQRRQSEAGSAEEAMSEPTLPGISGGYRLPPLATLRSWNPRR